MAAEHIHIDGIVQGVGFRPFVYRLAHRYGLHGWVRNSSLGVDIEVSGPADALEAFAQALEAEAPPLARITALRRAPLQAPPEPRDAFVILHSEDEGGFTLVSPDVATCPDCLRELLDPADRRYRYPFINCTNCGPRFSIIRALPYDRPNTTMAVFPMCPDCRAEYEDPLDRRFHAQPNACPVCGPAVELEGNGAAIEGLPGVDDVARTAALLRNGAIVAIKGLGGFHLACDATDAEAVARLRARKPRPHKPLAVMMTDLAMVRRHCRLDEAAEVLLTSPAAPIVLLAPRPDSPIAANVAPGQRTLGVMLPYTPLHHILLRDVGRPLVMTSGNRQNEPIARTNADARRMLGTIADAFLWHNREIHNRVDDSVWMVSRLGAMPIRRSRGYAPMPLPLPVAAPRPLLALGSQMKNTFALVQDDQAFLSQHIGEMDYLATWDFFRESIARYRSLFGIEPQLLAHDAHPDFTTTLWATMGNPDGLEAMPIYHHHAHIAACLAENGREGPVLGLAFDGTGYGADGTIWGGELLLADLRTFRRLAHWRPFPLPGGEAAIRRPVRLAAALLLLALGELPQGALPALTSQEAAIVPLQVERGLNTPLTSSCGRLFDAVAALLGLRAEITYEGQAAIELETLAAQAWPQPPFVVQVSAEGDGWLMEPLSLIRALWTAKEAGEPSAVLAARFHAAVIAAAVEAVQRAAGTTGLRTVALSGGCFQNRLLLEGLHAALTERGFEVLVHHRVPTNDGGIAYGQAAIAAARLAASREAGGR